MIQSYNSEKVIEIRRVNTRFQGLRLGNCFLFDDEGKRSYEDFQ